MIQKEAFLDKPDIEKGTILAGKYIAGNRLAQTELSIIYDALNKETEEKVAIKVINQSALGRARSGNDPNLENIITQMFYNEELILTNLDHSGIPKSYGQHFQSFSGQQIPIRVMEYIPSQLDSFFKNQKFLKRIAEFTIQFSAILDYLHEKGIIHSDISCAIGMK